MQLEQLTARAKAEAAEEFAMEVVKPRPKCVAFAGFPRIIAALKHVGIPVDSDGEETVNAALSFAEAYRNEYERRYSRHFI